MLASVENSLWCLSALTLCLTATAARAQSSDNPGEPFITVTSPRLERNLYDTPAAVSVTNAPDIREGQQRLQLDESLDTIPGLFFQNRYNFAQNLRLSTRGFGARAPFGIRGIRIQVDGIPYTLPDGQSQIDAVDLDSAQRIEVIRGPSSVQYGNASGGVIDITTARGDDLPPGARIRQDVGSNDYYKTTVQANGSQGENTHGIATMSWLNYNGYRDQSEAEKGLFNARLSHELGENQRLTATFNALHTPKAQDPAGLTEAQAAEDRRQASDFAERYDSGQDVDQQTLGLLYETSDVGAGDLTVSTFFTRRDFTQQLPFPGPSLIAYDRQFYGVSTDYQQGSKLAGLPLTWVVGADLHRQVDDRRRYSVAFNGEVTGQTQEEIQNATTAAVFAQGDLALTDRFNLSLGTRFDRLRLSVDDRFLSDGDDSGSRTYDEFSGFVGTSYRIAPRQQVYATIGTAFESPTFGEFANPDGGGFNPEVEPQKAVSREVGLRGALGEGFNFDLALFSIRVDDELLPNNEGSQTFYQNAGRTERNGIELGVGWDISYAWRVTSALTLADYTLEKFEDDQGNRLDGKRLPGLPREQWVTEVEWRGEGQQFAALEWQHVGDLYAENSNQTRVSEYWLLGFRAGDSFRFGSRSLSVYGGVRNLLDEDYFSNIRINANANQPIEDRGYFEPAPGRTFYAGLEWSF
jgi:iron complex outermembrane receptor protein